MSAGRSPTPWPSIPNSPAAPSRLPRRKRHWDCCCVAPRAQASAEPTEIRGRGEAGAAKSLSVFQQTPELANYIFRLNALEGSLKERSTLIFAQRTPPFDLFNGVSTNLMMK